MPSLDLILLTLIKFVPTYLFIIFLVKNIIEGTTKRRLSNWSNITIPLVGSIIIAIIVAATSGESFIGILALSVIPVIALTILAALLSFPIIVFESWTKSLHRLVRVLLFGAILLILYLLTPKPYVTSTHSDVGPITETTTSCSCIGMQLDNDFCIGWVQINSCEINKGHIQIGLPEDF